MTLVPVRTLRLFAGAPLRKDTVFFVLVACLLAALDARAARTATLVARDATFLAGLFSARAEVARARPTLLDGAGAAEPRLAFCCLVAAFLRVAAPAFVGVARVVLERVERCGLLLLVARGAFRLEADVAFFDAAPFARR